MLEPAKHKAWLREAGLLLIFLIFLFSYSGKTILRTNPAPEPSKQHTKVSHSHLPTPTSSERFFQLKPRLFPIPVPGSKNVSTPTHAPLQPKDSTQLPAMDQPNEQFVISSPVPWYQFYYFPGESDEYSLAG